MSAKIRPFEIFLIAIFAIAGIGGLIYLSTIKNAGSTEAKTYGASVSIWGTFEAGPINEVFNNISSTDEDFKVVSYRYIDERSFANELLNAIAEGNPPDLVLLPHPLFTMFRSKLMVIPAETLSERDFRSFYIDGAEIFARLDGMYAIPLAVDPLVLYWNKDLFSNVGLASASEDMGNTHE